MILCNKQVHSALDDKRLTISPEPMPREPAVAGAHCPYDTHTVDLRLFEELVVPKDDRPMTIDLARPGKIAALINDNAERITLKANQGYTLDPGKFILARTLESITLPIDPNGDTCLAARIEGKSSRARVGLLIHFTAPTVHPGWDGPLVLEMINLGHWPIQLSRHMYIAQLIVEEVRGCPIANPSQFQGQTTAAGTVGNGQPQDVA